MPNRTSRIAVILKSWAFNFFFNNLQKLSIMIEVFNTKVIFFVNLNDNEQTRFKKYLNDLNEQLEEQLLKLYEKFSPVKIYYNFVFNPRKKVFCRVK
jgi:hypothetical protein